MKILVTGGAGFIGSNIVNKLLALGYEIIVIDNFLTGQYSNLDDNFALKVINGTIEDFYFLDQTFKSFQPDIVIHTAVSFNEPDNYARDISINILGTVNVIECSKKYNVKRIIFFQTSLCYGINESRMPMLPDTPYLSGTYKGGSSYAITKIAAELYLEMSGLNFISFRLANVYGPKNLSGPIPAFYKNFKEGKISKIINSSRDFIYIDDVVNCTINALLSDVSTGFFNISTGLQTSIFDVFKLISDEMKSLNFMEPPTIFSDLGSDDVATISIDSELTKKTFSWEPSTNLKDGIKKTINWYITNNINRTFTHLKNINN